MNYEVLFEVRMAFVLRGIRFEENWKESIDKMITMLIDHLCYYNFSIIIQYVNRRNQIVPNSTYFHPKINF